MRGKRSSSGFVNSGMPGATILILEPRFAEGDVERLPRLAAELVRLKPDVIVTLGTPATVAVRRETASIPIGMRQEVLVKTLELLRELAPRALASRF